MSEFWSRRWLLFFRKIWHCVPKAIRVWTYHRLASSERDRKLASLIWCSSIGLLLKHDKANEGAALELLEAEAPDVPVPLVFDRFTADNGRRYVVLTRMPGIDARQVFYRMSYAERHQFADDVAAALARVRQIPNKTGHMFCGPAGGKLYDMHAGYEPCGPFDTEDELHTSMTGGYLPVVKTRWPRAFARPHLSAFTHSDLYLGNIMVDAGRFSGLIDWERAGFYPAYWENCQAVRGAFDLPEAEPMWERVWKDCYKDEVEMATWWMDSCPWGAPQMASASGEDVAQ